MFDYQKKTLPFDQYENSYLSEETNKIIKDLMYEMPNVRKYIQSDILAQDVSELKDELFSIFSFEELRKIDLIEMPFEEKKQFIKELLSLEPNERKQLLDDIIKFKSS